jgi:outer membrane protein TolC
MKSLVVLIGLSVAIWGETLPGLIRYAMTHSVGVLQSQAAARMAQRDRQMSEAAMGGELDVVGSATHYNIERTLAPVPPSAMKSKTPITTTQDIFSLGLSYQVPLFTGFAQTRQVRIDALSEQIAHLKTRLTKEQIAYNIKMLYYSLLAQDGVLSAQNRYVDALKKLRDQITQEVDAGQKAEVDLLKARADLSAARTQAQMLRSGIEMTRAALSAVVGRPVGRLSGVKVSVRSPRYSIAALMKRAQHTSRIAAEDLNIEKAEQMARKAQAGYFPQVALKAYGGKNYGQDIRTEEWDDEFIAQVGVNAKFDLFDFGKREAGVEKARIARMRAELKKRQALLDLRKQLTEAVEKIRQSYTEYTGALQVQRLARKSVTVERTRYHSGTATLNDLLMAESKYRLAAAKTIQSKYNYARSKAYLDFVLEKGIE